MGTFVRLAWTGAAMYTIFLRNKWRSPVHVRRARIFEHDTERVWSRVGDMRNTVQRAFNSLRILPPQLPALLGSLVPWDLIGTSPGPVFWAVEYSFHGRDHTCIVPVPPSRLTPMDHPVVLFATIEQGETGVLDVTAQVQKLRWGTPWALDKRMFGAALTALQSGEGPLLHGRYCEVMVIPHAATGLGRNVTEL